LLKFVEQSLNLGEAKKFGSAGPKEFQNPSLDQLAPCVGIELPRNVGRYGGNFMEREDDMPLWELLLDAHARGREWNPQLRENLLSQVHGDRAQTLRFAVEYWR
jgi:hypothetical protein